MTRSTLRSCCETAARFCLALAALFAFLLASGPTARGQGVVVEPAPVNQWGPVITLSSSLSDSVWPVIAADQGGQAHVSWVELEQANAARYDGPALFYSLRNGDAWTTPVDIILRPPGYFHLPSITTDETGRVHLFWHNWSRVYHSEAQANAGATSAYAWSPAEPVTEYDTRPYWSDATSSGETIFLVWEAEDIFFQRSDDGGVRWSEPIRIANTELASHRPRILRDGTGTLHVVWDDADTTDQGIIIWYAQSTDNGASWSEPTPLYDRMRTPGGASAWWATIATNGPDLVVTWREPFALKSAHSQDAGVSWSRPATFREVQNGGWGYVDMAVDSQNTIYAVGGVDDRIEWFEWRGAAQGWKPRGVVAEGQSSRWGQRVRAAITNGNVLHAVWMSESNNTIAIQNSSVRLPAPALPVRTLPDLPVPTAPAFYTPTPSPHSTAATPSPTSVPVVAGARPPTDQGAFATLLLPILASAGLVSIVVAARVLRSRR